MAEVLIEKIQCVCVRERDRERANVWQIGV